jgi:hypothetical protein
MIPGVFPVRMLLDRATVLQGPLPTITEEDQEVSKDNGSPNDDHLTTFQIQ